MVEISERGKGGRMKSKQGLRQNLLQEEKLLAS
jgi:hypothetical protein